MKISVNDFKKKKEIKKPNPKEIDELYDLEDDNFNFNTSDITVSVPKNGLTPSDYEQDIPATADKIKSDTDQHQNMWTWFSRGLGGMHLKENETRKTIKELLSKYNEENDLINNNKQEPTLEGVDSGIIAMIEDLISKLQIINNPEVAPKVKEYINFKLSEPKENKNIYEGDDEFNARGEFKIPSTGEKIKPEALTKRIHDLENGKIPDNQTHLEELKMLSDARRKELRLKRNNSKNLGGNGDGTGVNDVNDIRVNNVSFKK